MNHSTILPLISRFLITTLAFAMATSLAHADWLELPDGSKIKGTLVSEKDGMVTFKSKYTGVITVSEKESSIIKEKTITESTPGPQMPGDTPQLVDSPPSNEPTPETQAQAEKQAEQNFYFEKEVRVAKEYFQSIVPEGWTGKFDFGLTFISTSTESRGLNLGFKAKKDIGPNHYAFDANYNYLVQTQTDGTNNKKLDKWGVRFNYKHDIPQIAWLYFNYDLSYLRDMVKNINDQVDNSFGAGIRLFNREDFKFNIIPAATVSYIDAPGIDTKWVGYATISDTIEYHFTKSIRLEQNASYSVAPYNTSYYQYNFNLAFITKLTEWIEASLSIQRTFNALAGTNGAKSEEIILLSLGVPF